MNINNKHKFVTFDEDNVLTTNLLSFTATVCQVSPLIATRLYWHEDTIEGRTYKRSTTQKKLCDLNKQNIKVSFSYRLSSIIDIRSRFNIFVLKSILSI